MTCSSFENSLDVCFFVALEVINVWTMYLDILEIVFTIAAPVFDTLFIGCVLNTKTVYTTAEKLTFQPFY